MGNDYIAQPTEAQGYLVAAKGMLDGARPLGEIQPIPVFALTLLCGHACEAALKALLALSGINEATLSKSPYGHSILQLWLSAEQAGFSIPKPQPDWVAQLDNVYDKPFNLKYPLGFHGIVLPNQQAMLLGTEALVLLASTTIK